METQGLGDKDWELGTGRRALGIRRLGLGLLLALGIAVVPSITECARGGNQGEGKLEATVHVYDYAHVPSRTLITAEKWATVIFREVGLELRWCNVLANSAKGRMDVSCDQQSGSAELALRIVPRFKTVAGETKESTMGYAVGNMATVSYAWVERAVPSDVAMPSEILACAISHEIGHTLLGPNSHSRRGIMAANWTLEELRAAGRGCLLFTSEQAELIRAEVLARADAGMFPHTFTSRN